jgi:hypothetical protein
MKLHTKRNTNDKATNENGTRKTSPKPRKEGEKYSQGANLTWIAGVQLNP